MKITYIELITFLKINIKLAFLQYKKNVFITCELCGKESRGEKFHAKHLYTTHGLEQKVRQFQNVLY